MFIVLQQELQVAKDLLGLMQGLAFTQPLAGQMLSHFHDIGFGHQVTLLPVNLSKAPTPSAEEAMPLPSSPGGLVVECGRVTLRIEGVPDPQTLQLVLQQVLR